MLSAGRQARYDDSRIGSRVPVWEARGRSGATDGGGGLDEAVGQEERACQGLFAYSEFDEGAGAVGSGKAKLGAIGVCVVLGGASHCRDGIGDGGCIR